MGEEVKGLIRDEDFALYQYTKLKSATELILDDFAVLNMIASVLSKDVEQL